MKNTMIILFILLLPGFAHAGQWSREYSVDYTFGDNDNRAAARRIALNKLRMLAAADAGKYVQGDEVLMSNQYASSIHMATAAIIAINHVRESMSINTSGQSVLHITATAAVDDDVLKNRIASIQRDAALAHTLAKEDDKVAALFERMSKLNNDLSSAKESAKVYRLMAERTRVQSDMHSVFSESRLEFAPGTLRAMADHKEAREKEFLAKKKMKQTRQKILYESENQKQFAETQQLFYKKILEDTTVSTKIENVTKTADGYEIQVSYSYNPHMDCPHVPEYKHPSRWWALGTILTAGILNIYRAVDIYEQDKFTKKLKPWAGAQRKHSKNFRVNMGGCTLLSNDNSADWIVTENMDPEIKKYMNTHHIVLELSFLPGRTHPQTIDIFDGEVLKDHSGFYSDLFVHVSSDELNTISGVESSIKIKEVPLDVFVKNHKPARVLKPSQIRDEVRFFNALPEMDINRERMENLNYISTP